MPLTLEEIRYRSYREGDERTILPFLWECGYRPDERFWSWIHRECPEGPTLVELAWAGEQPVGHYAVLPRRLLMGGRPIRVGLAIHAVVHPQWRGLEVLSRLMRRIFDRCRKEGIPWIYGFPNEQIWLVYQKIFRWRSVGDLAALELPLDRWQGRRGDPRLLRLMENPVFDRRYEPFARPEAVPGWVVPIKSPAYLQWRYALNPKERYRLLELCRSDGTLSGFLVLKRYEKGGIRYGHLVDMGIDPASAQQLPGLMLDALSLFQKEGVQVASCWAAPGTIFFRTLEEMGFRPSGFKTPVGFREMEGTSPQELFSLERWHIVMGDSDAF